MAFAEGAIVEISLWYNWGGSQMANVFTYEADVIANTVTAVNLGEAWWNHVKATYRAMSPTSFANVFDRVVVKDLTNPSGEFGTFAIPTAERVGTRSTAGLGDIEPSFVAGGVRLTVGTRLTRPGQKRIGFLFDTDVVNQAIVAPMLTLMQTWANVISTGATLGAPAALTVLIPVVARRNEAGGVEASQPVTGNIVNTLVTSQVSRKLGRGV